MSFPNIAFGRDGAQWETRTQAQGASRPLGARMLFDDGREFRYVENGGTLAAAGKLYQSPVPVADHDDIATQTAGVVGDTTYKVTNGATTAIAVGDYKDGFLIINDDAGEAYVYKIKDTTAAAVDNTCTITFADNVTLQVATTTATTVTLQKNPWKDIIVHPSPPTAQVVGVACAAIPANGFGWVQTKGPAPVLIDGTVVINERVVASDATDGAVEAADNAITDGTPPTGHGERVLGFVMEVGATTEYGLVWLDCESV